MATQHVVPRDVFARFEHPDTAQRFVTVAQKSRTMVGARHAVTLGRAIALVAYQILAGYLQMNLVVLRTMRTLSEAALSFAQQGCAMEFRTAIPAQCSYHLSFR